MSPKTTEVEAAQAALAQDRARRSEAGAAAILQACAEHGVELQTQITITGGQIDSRVLIVAQ